MTARFAGSRSLDERRRRRIATNLDESKEFATEEPPSASPRASNRAVPTMPGGCATNLPLNRLVSAHLWKLGLIGFLGLLVGVGILLGGVRVEEIRETWGPTAAALFDFANGRLVTLFCSVMLLLASQLALLIWWVRSRSRADFSGKYRIWLWAAAFGFLFSLCTAAELHHVWSATLVWFWAVDFWKHETLCWLAPAVGSASALIWDVKADMRACRGSLSMFWLALLAWTAAAALTLGIGSESLATYGPATLAGMTMLGYYALFVSLLLHARHVIHVTPESPRPRPSLFTVIVCRPLLRLWKRLFRRRSHAVAEAVPPCRSAVKTAFDDPDNSDDAQSDPATPPTQDDSQSADPAASSSEEYALESDSQVRESASPSQEHRVDAPMEQSLLKGLSKRDRRKLRKEHREKQRNIQ